MTHRGPRAFKILTTYLKIWPEAYKILNVGEPSENSNVLITNTIMIDRERPTYEMNKRKRGLLVFINNINFDDNEKYPNRLGADIDTQHIKDLFGVYYHFEVDQFVKTNSTRNVRTTKFFLKFVLIKHLIGIFKFIKKCQKLFLTENNSVFGIYFFKSW